MMNCLYLTEKEKIKILENLSSCVSYKFLFLMLDSAANIEQLDSTSGLASSNSMAGQQTINFSAAAQNIKMGYSLMRMMVIHMIKTNLVPSTSFGYKRKAEKRL